MSSGPKVVHTIVTEAYLHAKFQLVLSKGLATIDQRHRQTNKLDNDPIAYGERFFGPPIVKRLALCYWSVACLYCLPVLS